MIETTNLTKRFGETVAVDGIDLTVEEGSVHGFVGPNGAGKTTAMQLLVGLLSPSEGAATIGGKPAGSKAAKELLGYSPQELALRESMTGRGYLEYMGRAAGMSKSDVRERADELLAWLDLEEAAGRRVGSYSGGMQRRLSLAQAMIHEPELLILDEPTTGLDPSGRQKIMDALRELPEQGMTVFVSSHVLAELEQYVGKVTILRDGEIVITDTIDAVQQAYGGQALAVETDDDERVAELLADVEVARNVEIEDGRLLVMTDDADELRNRLQGLLVEHDISLRSMSEAGTLQEAFADILEEGEQ
ncbi:ABC transporter ATP-binding protein [Halapricum desulfuricans]|uniref:ABC-type multidrug transport system, ATPase component n=1 Tax=Halapricum desulfuricans TaxID=2841257 RepID=A0A897N918_9EURY|nr:ABC transporter ATP-binding protein [Halapricum desulfuricans]QSG07499.1 ABC-type multidrug transport system, ATPase component [Halapricum desulfuricans]